MARRKRSFGVVSSPRVLFAAGGTGGHIYPALAAQKALSSMNGGVESAFICGSRPLEIDLYRRSNVKPLILDMPSRKQGAYYAIIDFFHILKGVFQAFLILKKWKPDWILAQGGYVTAPVLSAARLLGIPYDIQEQNAVPGRTNKWFASGAHTIYCSFQEAMIHFTKKSPKVRCVYSGTPLRQEAIIPEQVDKALVKKRMGVDPFLPLLLITGGSQGAKNLNRILLSALRRIDEERDSSPFQCLWSAGAQNIDWIEKELALNPMNAVPVHVRPYIDDMGESYSVADAAVSRAGAGAVAELTSNRIPAIFVPLPGAKDDHQRYNALTAVKAGAAFLVEENEFARDELADRIEILVNSEDVRRRMSNAARELSSVNAAERIASDILQKIKDFC